MSIFSSPDFDNHEQVVFCHDEASGLKAIIAIHNTNRGPSLGGCRMWPYASEEEAVTDVLRLSRGMTYKSALAKLPYGGGKSVIIGDPRLDKSPALFRAMGRAVQRLAGRYIVAEDVGISVPDVELMQQETRHVAGTSAGGAGDPSPATAYGVYMGLRAAVQHKLGRNDLDVSDKTGRCLEFRPAAADSAAATGGRRVRRLGTPGYHIAERLPCTYSECAHVARCDRASRNCDRCRGRISLYRRVGEWNICVNT